MRNAPLFKQGEIIAYSYLWRWQAEKGETEGRKDRPVCVALPLRKNGVTHLFLLAITGTRPRVDQKCLVIPEIEARRAGLRDWKEGWVILSECNYDVAEQSFYIDPARAPYGRFSEAFTARIKAELRGLIAAGGFARVDRTLE